MHRQRGAGRDEQIAVQRRALGTAEHVGVQGLSERDGGRLQDAAAGPAGRVRLTGGDPLQRGAHRAGRAAVQTHRVEDRPVQLQHPVPVQARALVQLVDVLGQQRAQPAGAVEVDESAVSGVGFGAPGRVLGAAAPGLLADPRIGDVAVDVAEPLGGRVLGPHPVRAPEVRDAGGRRHSRTGEGGDPARTAEQFAGPSPVLAVHASPHHGSTVPRNARRECCRAPFRCSHRLDLDM